MIILLHILIFVYNSQDNILLHLWSGCPNDLGCSTLHWRHNTFYITVFFLEPYCIVCLKSKYEENPIEDYDIGCDKRLNFDKHFLKNILMVVKNREKLHNSVVFCCMYTR